MDEALMNLHRSGMQSLVLDLRGNPGGLLTTAIELSNKFLPSGTIVSTRGRTTQDNMQEKASNTQTWKVPLVVLIDENSASASEIFAAAIQENGRGVIVGRQSYGKGTVQTHFPLRSVGGNLKLTTAKFYSPKGREMANAGVTPDVQVTATSYRGTPSTADQDIQSALEVAQADAVPDARRRRGRAERSRARNGDLRRARRRVDVRGGGLGGGVAASGRPPLRGSGGGGAARNGERRQCFWSSTTITSMGSVPLFTSACCVPGTSSVSQ
jgi:hypothetical protein